MGPDPIVVTTPLITGFVETLKRAGVVPPRYAALTSLAVGVAASMIAYLAGGGFISQELYEAIVRGVAVGLAASGLYSVANVASGRTKVGGPDLTETESRR